MHALAARLQDFVAEENLFSAGNHLLAAVSGGIDSMVLLHILQNTGHKLSVAHCNFKLRGDEADADEAFVRAYCKKNNLPLHAESFNTKDIAKQSGESIQMAARRLRYDWFNALLLAHEYAFVATAHNANDVAETFFVNLSRGTGLSGLTGIKPKMGNVVRPLLFATRADIEAYAKANKIKWRDDSSNQSVKYRRNLIRHKVIPIFENINPSFNQSIIKTIARLEQSNAVLKQFMDAALEEVISEKDGKIYISIKHIKKLKPLSLYLFELLHPYGFNAEQVEDIEQCLSHQSGQRFIAEEYELLHDRDFLIICPKKERDEREYTIEIDTKQVTTPVKLAFSVKTYTAKINLKQPANVAILDFDKLTFPLTLRRWRVGDKFQPFGMSKGKLLSDFFKDSKLSKDEKDDLWILESNGKIAWIVGHRADNRFRVDDKTKLVVTITCTPPTLSLSARLFSSPTSRGRCQPDKGGMTEGVQK
ncbi:MAG: tRNA lysidine(34) synthetase TilS [Sphingobacteriales bacterium JAD_PAG50586_3]|nr:MAG: tRNA lysidine(34) synthetase TilS [Sphingobacteriales bacterium JAD_PAG50586_3]